MIKSEGEKVEAFFLATPMRVKISNQIVLLLQQLRFHAFLL